MTRDQEIALIEVAIQQGKLTKLPELTPEEASERTLIKLIPAKQRSSQKTKEYWQRRKQIIKEQNKRECPGCGKTFHAKRKDTVYCGDLCRFKVKYQRTKEQQQEKQL